MAEFLTSEEKQTDVIELGQLPLVVTGVQSPPLLSHEEVEVPPALHPTSKDSHHLMLQLKANSAMSCITGIALACYHNGTMCSHH